jgi:methyl-accepting chemotaxis protein
MKDQPSFNNTNITNQTIKNEDSSISISENKEKKEKILKGKSSILKRIIIAAIVAILIAIICIILVLVLRRDRKPKSPIIFNPESSSSSSSSGSSALPPSSSASPSGSSKPGSSSSSHPITPPEPKPRTISYKEAEELIDSKTIEENHKILNESYNCISESLEIFNDTRSNINPINTNITYSIPEFLDNTTDSSLKIVKSDINLYNSKYEELAENANNLTELVYESINNLSTPLDNIKEGVSKMAEEFENKIIAFSLPLSLINLTERNDKRRLRLNEKVDKYKEEIEKLNNKYNMFFAYISHAVEVLSDNMMEIPISVKDINDNLEKSMIEYGDLLGKFKKGDSSKKMHENLLSIKQSFLDIKKNMNKKKEQIEDRISLLEELYKNNTFNLEQFQNETDTITERINNISDSIMNEINIEREEKGEKPIIISKPTSSSIIADSIIKSIYRSFQILIDIEIIKENKIISIIIIINVEERTSLDLLFIMDITGSMGPYVEQAKANVIDIINRIINDCPGIDINLGFIGYRDIEEEITGDIIDIDFTKNHTELKNKIKNVEATGGGDEPEDVAWAFERALNKTWKNNARFIVFVADAPNHGTKYGGDNRTISGRNDLEELIKELAENGISLFCMEIDSHTKIMLNVFENVYKNYVKSQFQIVPMSSANNFSDIVVDSAKKVYENQRMND